MKLCGYPMSRWLASWKILRKHPRESVRVSTHGSGMAKEGFLCFRREQCLALACLVFLNRSGTPGLAVAKADVNIGGVQCNK